MKLFGARPMKKWEAKYTLDVYFDAVWEAAKQHTEGKPVPAWILEIITVHRAKLFAALTKGV